MRGSDLCNYHNSPCIYAAFCHLEAQRRKHHIYKRQGSCFTRVLAMSRLVLIGRYVRSFLEVFSAAQAVTVAIQAKRRPSNAALKVLGISPEQFRTIRA
jgi:hypothetical protein